MLLSDKLYMKNSQMTKVYDRIEEDSNGTKPKENKTHKTPPLGSVHYKICNAYVA